MTKTEVEFFLCFNGDEDKFVHLLQNSAKEYSNLSRPYDVVTSAFPNPIHELPDRLFKYIDFDGGLLSLKDSNVQFSHPLSFRSLKSGMADISELWYDRIYVDLISLFETRLMLKKDPLSLNRYLNDKFLFSYLMYNHAMNTVERNKILCLARSANNPYLWGKFSTGLCIEYDTELFKDKKNLNFYPKKGKFSLLCDKINYVESIVPYPVRWDNGEWLSNLLFIKDKTFRQEDEFRIILTEDRSLDSMIKEWPNRTRIATHRILDINPWETDPIRPGIDIRFIKKVYYTEAVKNEQDLIDSLLLTGIPFEKIVFRREKPITESIT